MMFALIDCNNFFVSCERVFKPHLNGKPTLVLSCNDGCVIARSQEVKDIGVPMGVPLFKIREMVKQHDIQLFSTNFDLYRDMSRRVMETIRSVAGETEVYSIDECFIQIPPHVQAFDLCRKIREEVLKQTGIPVSIGVAATKTLAKLANAKAKSRRTSHVFIFDPAKPHRIKRHLAETKIGEIWGIGRGLSEQLTLKGINSPLQFISLSDSMLRTLFGVIGLRIALELRGIRAHGLAAHSAPKKGIISSRSFGTKVTDKEVLWDSLKAHTDSIARELRQAHQVTQCIRIGIYTNRYGEDRYHTRKESKFLSRPTNSTIVLLDAVRNLLDELYEPGIPYSKSGVSVSFLSSDEYVHTPSLFEDPHEKEESSIEKVLENLEEKHGTNSIVLGSLFSDGRKRTWMPHSEMRSPHYTTSWNDILRIQKKMF